MNDRITPLTTGDDRIVPLTASAPELDPRPWVSPYHNNRSAYAEFDDAFFEPRPGYEQDRIKYE